MEKLYYLNRVSFTNGDTLKAWRFAMNLVSQNQDVDTITLLVYQQTHCDGFLSELGLSSKNYKTHTFPLKGLKGQIHTVKTYDPNYIFADEPNRELLIAVGVPPKELEKFVDKSRVKYWIIVPWLLEENMSFLYIHGGIDIESNQQLALEYQVDNRLAGAVSWLKATSYPNENYHHPNDEERLKCMANAIKHYRIPFEHNTLWHYCINHGLTNNAAAITVEYFEKAQKRMFSGQAYGFDELFRQMNRTDWDE